MPKYLARRYYHKNGSTKSKGGLKEWTASVNSSTF